MSVSRADLLATLARPGWGRARVFRAYADRHGVDVETARRRLERLPDPVPLGVADDWLVALGLHLEDLPRPPEVEGPRRTGGRRRGAGLLSEAQVRACHALYQRGLSVRQVAERVWERAGYATPASCAESLQHMFARRGLPRRSVREALVMRNWRHGRGTRDRDEGAYRRWLREQGRGFDGPYRPPCAGTRRDGAPCRRPAAADGAYCVAHDPRRREELAAHLARGRVRLAGEAHPLARLTEAAVRDIRARPRELLRVLAAEHGVSVDTVWRIRHGLSWRHLLDEVAGEAA